jgi:serine O-acetyltransferase
VGENSRVGAGSVVLRNVPPNSTVVGVPAHIVLRDGKRVVLTDPKEISDPLSDVIIRLAAEVHELREKFQEHSHETLSAEADLSIDEETEVPSKKKLTPAEVFGDDYYDFQI